ncbi:protein kinase domain-containing protein [Nocardia sp. IBHARD005]|uniref:protein kinase domain-containing protein n=1 Tax=Nocardia sp. IBHARD005 TaxID=3457765 RepID=UPI00405A15B8
MVEFIAGYAVERVLGQGGMGTVYLARHPRLPRSVALKLLDENMFGDAEVQARFQREADLAARLDHPNIVAVYDRGVERNRPWIAMQYVRGTDGAEVGVFESLRAVRVVTEFATALDFAHTHGVLHRDIKPGNILLGESVHGLPERVLLADFGIARLRVDQSPLTRTGSFTATLAFASPGQLAASALDPRCDQYSLACTFFAMLTGTAPFNATNPVMVIQSHMSAPPPSIVRLRPDLPLALDAVLARAMAKRPADRFASCGEFADAVCRAFEVPGDMSSPAVPGHAVTAAPEVPAGAHRSVKPMPVPLSPVALLPDTEPRPAMTAVPVVDRAAVDSGPVRPPVVKGRPGWAAITVQRDADAPGPPHREPPLQPRQILILIYVAVLAVLFVLVFTDITNW